MARFLFASFAASLQGERDRDAIARFANDRPDLQVANFIYRQQASRKAGGVVLPSPRQYQAG